MTAEKILRSGRRLFVCAALVALIGATSAAAQTAEQVFKNVQVLKGIPVDDFMQTMGIMAAALQFDCSDCHEGAGTDRVNWAADTAC